MIHLRIVSPCDSTDEVVRLIRAGQAASNVAVLRGAALDPPGDLVLADVVREGVNTIVSGLKAIGVDRAGSIALENIDVVVSRSADDADRRVPGYGTDAAVWEEVEARVRDESVLTVSFLVFLVVAALIAAVGLLEDSPILIVGAMVVGPEFGPIAGLSVGFFRRRPQRIRVAAMTLTIGLAVGAVAALAGTLVADAFDLVPGDFSPRAQPLTGFIVDPSVLSGVVALLAGVVGTLSLTEAKAGALVGVLISVTTIPAVAAIGVSGALGAWDDAWGATIQLALNVVALVVAGVVTLFVQRAAWARIARPAALR
ncbi:MAG: DUF389 domain-containing protein [Acidimicrobiales bacterium]